MMAALANKVDTSLLLQSAEGDEGCLIENFLLTLWRKSIVDIGLPCDGCRRSVFCFRNTGIKTAVQWAEEHINEQNPISFDMASKPQQRNKLREEEEWID